MDIRALWRGKRPDQIAADMRTNLIGATEDNAEDVKNTARRIVHKRTRKTEKSIRVRMQGPYLGHVLADFGGPFEEARGEPHNFATQAVEEVKPRALNRVRQAVEAAKR